MPRIAPILVVLTTALMLSAGTAQAALAVDNDAKVNATPLKIDDYGQYSNVGATIENAEALTDNDPNGNGCDTTGSAGPSGYTMGSTIWFKGTGNGRTLTLETFPDDGIDTVLAVYNAANQLIACNDDVRDDDDFRWSALRFLSTAGQAFYVQIGSNCGAAADCANRAGQGGIGLALNATPADDNRSNASALTLGETAVRDLAGATEEPGEVLKCGDSPYGKTRWARVSVPATGTLTVTATSTEHDSVLAVYASAGSTPLACGDDFASANTGSARVDAKVGPGDYLIQMAGYGSDLTADSSASFVLSATFVENLDIDGDGVNRPADCNDNNAAIRPGAVDTPSDGIDQDCSGADATPVIVPTIRPPAPTALPFTLSFEFKATKRTTRLTALKVKFISKGASVTVTCKGSSCPKQLKGKGYTKANAAATLNLSSFIKKPFKPGTTITFTVSRADSISVIKVLKFRSNKKPQLTTACLAPGAKRPAAC